MERKKLIKKFQEPSGKIDYTLVIRSEEDSEVPVWNRTVYSQFNPSWGYPNLLGAVTNTVAAGVRRAVGKPDKLQYEVEDKAGDNYWRYRLGLSVDPEYFGEILDDGSVTLPRYLESEIPTDTLVLKNRIAADEEYIKNALFTLEQWNIANGLINTDKEALEALRHTYKTGEPVSINEFSYNSRPLLRDGYYESSGVTPLNMLLNFTILYIPSTNSMYYGDEYDFNLFEKFVPGESYRINGEINLNTKKKNKKK